MRRRVRARNRPRKVGATGQTRPSMSVVGCRERGSRRRRPRALSRSRAGQVGGGVLTGAGGVLLTRDQALMPRVKVVPLATVLAANVVAIDSLCEVGRALARLLGGRGRRSTRPRHRDGLRAAAST